MEVELATFDIPFFIGGLFSIHYALYPVFSAHKNKHWLSLFNVSGIAGGDFARSLEIDQLAERSASRKSLAVARKIDRMAAVRK